MGIALRTSSALAVIVAAGLLVPIGASGAIVKRSDSKKIDEPLEIGTVTARCPNGSNATGGGFKASPFSVARNRFAIVFESRKSGQDGWRVRGQLSEGSTGPARVTAIAYCDNRGPSTSEVAKDGATSQPHEIKTEVARCPGSKNAQAGGFATPPPFFTGGGNGSLNGVSGSTPAGKDGWRIQVTSGFSFSPFPTEFTGFAYCAGKAAPGKKRGKKAIKPNANNPSEFGKGSAKSKPCPRAVVAGGFSQKPINPGGGLESSYLNLHASVVGGERWKVSATQGGLAKSTLRSIALCG